MLMHVAADNDFPVDIVALNSSTYILPGDKKTVSFGMYSTSSFAQHSKSSFFHVVSSTALRCDFNIHDQALDSPTPESQYVEIHCTATLCTSLLYMEKIHFQSFWNNANRCFETRDIQIWNRSECVLHYEIEHIDKNSDITIQFVESSSVTKYIKNTSQNRHSHVFEVPPFASQRLALMVWPGEAIVSASILTILLFDQKMFRMLLSKNEL